MGWPPGSSWSAFRSLFKTSPTAPSTAQLLLFQVEDSSADFSILAANISRIVESMYRLAQTLMYMSVSLETRGQSDLRNQAGSRSKRAVEASRSFSGVGADPLALVRVPAELSAALTVPAGCTASFEKVYLNAARER